MRFICKLNPKIIFFQSNDEYLTDGYNIDSAEYEHGQVLEGSARYLRDTETSGGAHKE